MPIISGGSDQDYSNLSYASCTSLNHIFTITSDSEAATVKGVYYSRVRRVQHQDQHLYSVDPKKQIIINVGGTKYLMPWSTLDEFPLSRLGRLKFCSSYDEIFQVCDDYDETSNEFFFDRNPGAFRMILTFLGAGKLRLLREMCVLSFQEELLYWGIQESNLERCCLRKLYVKLEEMNAIRREEEIQRNKSKAHLLEDESRCGLYMNKLRDMVDNPHSGLPGKVFACLSIAFVAITVVSLCISTMPDLRAEEDRGECSQKCYNIFVIESTCVAWFSFEFILRFIQARSKCSFFKAPLNIIDVLAISPYYVSLLVQDGLQQDDKPSGNTYLEKVGLVLRILRALRILYVMRLARHSLGLQTLGLTVRRCIREFGLLLLFLCVAVTLFAPLVYLAENEMGRYHEFTSIPASYWWAIISMTTVGYGDMVPRSIPGQVVALSSILSGILIMAFPATSIFHTFSRSYLELKREQEKLQRHLRILKSEMQNSESDTFDDADSLLFDSHDSLEGYREIENKTLGLYGNIY
ncbi:potassium voltage-gated channel subfamily G member 4 [Protopterus annectens]|uniref:potassium voltage-gated channel subfamily G member 4 n=1 Tax=Protopterus annectens TaxID=7888 RepID=UPI001CFAE9E0|nr:potassium voltage-gated channel subfamily G member 4 [Protopterus annectens]